MELLRKAWEMQKDRLQKAIMKNGGKTMKAKPQQAKICAIEKQL